MRSLNIKTFVLLKVAKGSICLLNIKNTTVFFWLAILLDNKCFLVQLCLANESFKVAQGLFSDLPQTLIGVKCNVTWNDDIVHLTELIQLRKILEPFVVHVFENESLFTLKNIQGCSEYLTTFQSINEVVGFDNFSPENENYWAFFYI